METSLRGKTKFVALLKACSQDRDLDRGIRIHAHLLKRGFLKKCVVVGNSLINMYAKCGALGKAQQVFDAMPKPNVVSCNTLIVAYAQHGYFCDAHNIFKWMESEGLTPNEVTFLCILKACRNMRAAVKGELIHDTIVKKGLIGKNIRIGHALIDMYAKCGAILKAKQVFDELPSRDIIAYNMLISGYAQHGPAEEALLCYERMRHAGPYPDSVTYASLLKVCGSIGSVEKGAEIHADIRKEGLLMKKDILHTALVSMYAKCGVLEKARKVFDELRTKDVVSWTALITGYCQHGHCEEALACFEEMQMEGVLPNKMTLACALKACGSVGAIEKGLKIHDEILREGLLGRDCVLGNSLVDMFAKCGKLEKAQEVFDKLHDRDVVTWTALISGYAQHGWLEKALDCFDEMQGEGFCPNAMTYSLVLKVCGIMGNVEKGGEIHANLAREEMWKNDWVLRNALVGMYVSCDQLARAQEVEDSFGTTFKGKENHAEFGEANVIM